MKKTLYLFTILTLLMAGCAEDEISTFGSISGTVRDNIDNEPLSGVRVDIIPGGTSVITGSNGVFSFRDMEAQDYTLNFSKEGYGSDTKKVTVVPGQNSDASVVLTQIAPILKVTPQKLDFENEATTLALDISNTGKGELEWSISEEIDWLSCYPTSGKTTNESSSVVVTVSRARLERGSYSGNIVISSNGGSQTIPVTISSGDIALKVEPTELDFGTLTNSIRLTMKNVGTSNISYQIESSADWLTVSRKSGTITQSDYINVIVTRDGLSSGNYNATITISVDGANIVVPVKMEVAVNAKPTISIENVTDITYNSAVLHGSMVSVGSAKVTRYGFCYGEQPGVTIENSFTNLGNCSEPVALESTITNLKSETKYYVRAYAENIVGIVYSDKELTFTTSSLPTIPSVATGNVSDITSTSARVQGSVTSLGNVSKITHYGHVWSRTAQPTIENGKSSDLGESNATKSFTSELTGLESNTTYHVRAYATNEKGTAYGEDITFTTNKTPVEVATSDISEITRNSAIVSGTVTDAHGHTIVEYGACWNTQQHPLVTDNAVVSDAMFVCRLTKLMEQTTYYVRVYVKTSDGLYFYGNEKTFTTSKAPVNPTNGLYAYYTFEGNFNNTVDGAPNGQGINSPTYVEGVNGTQAVQFSVAKNSYMTISKAMIDGLTYSVSFWIKGLSDGHLWHIYTGKVFATNNHEIDNILSMQNGKLTFSSGWSWWYSYDGEYSGTSFTQPYIDAEKWNMITLTSSSQSASGTECEMKLFINGEIIDIITCSMSTKNKGLKFIFGGELDNMTPPSMTVDNLRVYNTRALSEEEVMQIYEYEK